MADNLIHISSNIQINHVTPQKVLQNGSQVLVRILGDLGNNRYESSIAGVRTNIFSEKTLQKGTVFKANIIKQNGVITVVPQKEASVKNPVTITKILQTNQNSSMLELIQSQSLANFIKSMGMIPDNLSNTILLQMKNLGLKFNGTLVNKIHDIAAKYPGKEKLAVELIMDFLQKGMEFDADAIADVLLSLEDDFEKDGKKQNKSDFYQNNKIEKNQLTDEINVKTLKAFFNSLLENEDNPIGLITIANNLGTKKDISGYGSWLIFPFDITENNIKISSGIFRILLSDEKKIIKFCIEHNINEKEQIFVLNFENNHCKALLVNSTESEKQTSIIERLKQKLLQSGFDIEVKWEDAEKIQGNCYGMEDFFQVDGEV